MSNASLYHFDHKTARVKGTNLMSTDSLALLKVLRFKHLVHCNVLQTDHFIVTPLLCGWRNDMARGIKDLFCLGIIIQHSCLLA